jgi:hypothetical protein
MFFKELKKNKYGNFCKYANGQWLLVTVVVIKLCYAALFPEGSKYREKPNEARKATSESRL